MNLFNETAAAALAAMNSSDAAYCAKLEKRFENMGISSKAASNAVVSLAEADAVPQVGSWCVALGAFKGIFSKKAKASLSVADLDGDLAEVGV